MPGGKDGDRCCCVPGAGPGHRIWNQHELMVLMMRLQRFATRDPELPAHSQAAEAPSLHVIPLHLSPETRPTQRCKFVFKGPLPHFFFPNLEFVKKNWAPGPAELALCFQPAHETDARNGIKKVTELVCLSSRQLVEVCVCCDLLRCRGRCEASPWRW